MLDCEDFLIDLFLPNYTCIISILLDVFLNYGAVLPELDSYI